MFFLFFFFLITRMWHIKPAVLLWIRAVKDIICTSSHFTSNPHEITDTVVISLKLQIRRLTPIFSHNVQTHCQDGYLPDAPQ